GGGRGAREGRARPATPPAGGGHAPPADRSPAGGGPGRPRIASRDDAGPPPRSGHSGARRPAVSAAAGQTPGVALGGSGRGRGHTGGHGSGAASHGAVGRLRRRTGPRRGRHPTVERTTAAAAGPGDAV